MTDAQAALAQVREAMAAGPTPGPWSVETVPTSCGVCHKVGPFPGKRPDDPPRHACLYADYPSAGNPADDELMANANFIAACHPEAIRELLAEHDEDQKVIAVWRGRTERAEAELDDLRDMLLRKGFVECDIPACNCGSWHHRYGLPERMQEIRDALAEAGHELSNANGNLTLNALKELVAERDALKADAERLRAERDELARQLDPMGEPTSPDELIARLHAECAEDEAIKRDAQRYRWLRGDLCPDHSVRWTQWEVRCWKAPSWTGDLRRADLDDAIDAARGKE